MFLMVSKNRGKACLRANISWTTTVVGGEGIAESRLVFLGIGVFSTGLRVVEVLAGKGTQARLIPREC